MTEQTHDRQRVRRTRSMNSGNSATLALLHGDHGAGLADRHPTYQGVWKIHERLQPQEIRRRLWHILPGFLPFLLWVIPHSRPLSLRMRGLIAFDAVSLLSLAYLYFRSFKRSREQSGCQSILGYALPVLFLLLALPAKPELGLSVLAIVAFGDGLATLAGLLANGKRLPWNPEKTWVGMQAFVIAAVPMSALIYWGEMGPSASLKIAALCTAPASLIAAIAESVASSINDNIRVSLTATLMLLVTQTLFVGW